MRNSKGTLMSALLWSAFCLHMALGQDSVVFDVTGGVGRTFDGVGGLSGGGATSKLLPNYPKEQRDQILDYLFKPNFGASLHILKVEIGGDAQSTDGTEASHMHNSWDENYERGYEWWLMTEAKKRNPNIKLYGLPWGFPGWVGQGTASPYANIQVTADYIVRWVNGAKQHYNLTIDFIGIWNEKPYNVQYIKTLRSMLDERGFQHTKVIAADGKWDISDKILNDADLANAVYGIGCHYPGTQSTSQAVNTGKPLWASEDFSTFNDNVGGGCWARILNQNYVNGNMTSTISWNLIGSYYKDLPFYRDGLMTATEPWSGNYVVETPIWFSAHTAQFTSIGWNYLKHGSGAGHLPEGGSYVGLVNPLQDQLTIVMETMIHNHSLCIRPPLPRYAVKPQNITITLKGKLAKITEMNVWYSKLNFDGPKNVMFEKRSPLKFVGGQAKLSLDRDEVFTLTTITTGQKGQYAQPPQSKPFPLPYKDDFESYKVFQEAFNLVPQTGSYEVLSANDGNQFMRQTMLQAPVSWCKADQVDKTVNFIGNSSWSDIFVEVDFQLPNVNSTTGVFVAGRVDQGGCETFLAHGIFFFAFPDKYIIFNDLAQVVKISEGTLSFKAGEWHKLSLLLQGDRAIGAFDSKGLFNISIPAKPSTGFTALGTDTYGLADFDNLHIATSQQGQRIMKEYFYSPLLFESEWH